MLETRGESGWASALVEGKMYARGCAAIPDGAAVVTHPLRRARPLSPLGCSARRVDSGRVLSKRCAVHVLKPWDDTLTRRHIGIEDRWTPTCRAWRSRGSCDKEDVRPPDVWRNAQVHNARCDLAEGSRLASHGRHRSTERRLSSIPDTRSVDSSRAGYPPLWHHG